MNEPQRSPGHQIVVDGSLSSKGAPQRAVRQAELTASRVEDSPVSSRASVSPARRVQCALPDRSFAAPARIKDWCLP